MKMNMDKMKMGGYGKNEMEDDSGSEVELSPSVLDRMSGSKNVSVDDLVTITIKGKVTKCDDEVCVDVHNGKMTTSDMDEMQAGFDQANA